MATVLTVENSDHTKMKWNNTVLILLTIATISIPCASWWTTIENASSYVYPTYPDNPTTTPRPTKTFAPKPTQPTIEILPTTKPQIYSIKGTECIPKNTLTQIGTVTGVLDGDTIIVQIGERRYSVRYIGINTPERRKPGAKEAYYENIGLVTGKTVTLIQDTSNTDKYGRLLRYVLTDTTFVNYELVRTQFAKPTPYPPNIACSQEFTRAYGGW